ncbi:MAG: hypothetical protein AB7O24_27215, partial [Kofleriaceae bacterium]
RWFVILLMAITQGCFFSDPSLEGAQFQCDGSHPCPGTQTCTVGLCTGGMSSGNGIACGSESCGDGEQCCYVPASGGSCISAGAQCGGFGARCDGPDDCDDGMVCCNVTGENRTQCGYDSDALCQQRICTMDEECADQGMSCCFLFQTPWGVCGIC